MPGPGGKADKIGNHYEAVWTVDALLDVFEGRCRSITVEAFGDESVGVEFHLTLPNGRLQFHCLKRQKQGGDWSVADLCRTQEPTGRSILGDLAAKLQLYPDCELCFVSATGANRLRELCESAVTSQTIDRFNKAIHGSKDLKTEFGRVVEICHSSEEMAFTVLQAIRIHLQDHELLIKNTERRIEMLLYRKDGAEFFADDTRRLLAEYLLANLGNTIHSANVGQFLNQKGFGKRDWRSEPAILDSIASTNTRYLKMIGMELINSAYIPRGETGKIVDAISDPQSLGVLLLGSGGFGKSCVLAQVLSELLKRNVPAMCLRMDSFEPCNTTKQVGQQLDLPKSPAMVLAGVADNDPSVLIVDQLDAMSTVSGRNSKMWEVFSELLDEIRSYPNMRLVVACRDFDLNHDSRLRGLQESHSGLTKVRLERLSQAEIDSALKKALAIGPTLTESQYDILRVPFHLLLYLEGEPSKPFTSAGQLYDRFWDRKRQKVRERLGREPRWTEVIDALCHKMSHEQVLFAPMNILDDWESDAYAMVSEHILIQLDKHRQVRFFHESFFDYAFARRFRTRGKGLVEFLAASEQHLFRRAQVRQILTYQREHDFRTYLNNLRAVLACPDIRFHIKRMVISGLHQIETPNREEWSIVETLLSDKELAPFCHGAIRNHTGWFDLLQELGVLQKWLASSDEDCVNNAAWHLGSHTLHERRSRQIAALIGPYVSRSAEWDKKIMRMLSWGEAHRSPEMAQIQLTLLRNGAYDADSDEGATGHDFWHQFHDVPKEAPKFIIDFAATWLEHCLEFHDDGEAWHFLGKAPLNNSHYGAQLIGQAAAAEPLYAVEKLLPLLVNTVIQTEDRRGSDVRNRAWPYLTNRGDPFGVDEAILLCVRRSLEWLATNDPSSCRKHIEPIKVHPHQTFSYLLMSAWRAQPEVFADECAEYLIADDSRFYIGYSSWSGSNEGTGESAVSRMVLRAISRHCSIELHRAMENAIIGHIDEWEKDNPKWRGSAELLVLRALDKSRISRETALRIEELERKFPTLNDAIVPEDSRSMASVVGPPISPKAAGIMTDDQWISAMQKYDGSTDRFRGGPVELSRLLAGFARKERTRFAELVQQMPDTVDSMYFSAILDGICSRYIDLSKEEKALDVREHGETPTGLFLRVVDRLHALPNRPCGSAIVGCFEVISERDIPATYLDVLSYYATDDPDPETDIWKEDANGRKYHGGDPYDHGINCVRGQAARAISGLLYDDNSRFEILRPALQSLAADPVISVRTCAITAFLPVLNFAPDIAVGLFCQACVGSEDMCGTDPFDRFVHYAIATHYAQLKELLQFALRSSNNEAVQNAARHIIVADLDDEGVEAAAGIRRGTPTMRRTAASVYAHNLSDKDVGNKCAGYLVQFFDDDDESVRQEVANAFFRMPGERILELQDLIRKFVESKAFETDPYGLLHALEECNVELPDVICQAAERLLGFLGVTGTSAAYHGSMAANSIATLVVRQYEQTTDTKIKTRCLDLIDQMERMAWYGIGTELEKLDR